MSDDAPDPDLKDALAAFRMRPRFLRSWLEDRRRFCRKHGGERYYPEVLALVEECLAEVERKERERC